MNAPGRAVLVLTPGEPAGIGPDLAIQLAQEALPCPLLVCADPELLAERAAALGLPLAIDPQGRGEGSGHGRLDVVPLPLAAPVKPGRLDPRNASYVLDTLRCAVRLLQEGRAHGLVTGPVHKGLINEARLPFTGHTEFLAELTGAPLPVMMLVAGRLRVALATTHLPLRAVADAITAPRLRDTLRILARDLRIRFAIPAPRILVAGLNPHAGEGGHLGREELDILVPVLEALRAEGLDLVGPLPADTLFTPQRLRDADAVLAMYHDQGLPVLKYAGFGSAVNVTLGLPIVRTSVDHGTALELAGTGSAEAGSLRAAIGLAWQLAAGTDAHG